MDVYFYTISVWDLTVGGGGDVGVQHEDVVQPHVAVLGLETLATILGHTVVRESVCV